MATKSRGRDASRAVPPMWTLASPPISQLSAAECSTNTMASQQLRSAARGMHAALLLALVLAAVGPLQVLADGSRSPVTLGTVQASVMSASGEQLVTGKGAYPAKLLSSPQISAKQSIEVFLSLQRVGSDAAAYAVGKARKDGTFSINAPASIIGSQIGKKAGVYAVTLLVGDPSASTSVSWLLGEVELVVEAGEDLGAGLPPRTAASQPVTNSKPAINHVFRSADKRPPPIVSLVFTGLALVPLVAVTGYVLFGLGANFKAWPRSGVTSLAALGFHGLLAATLGVYVLFWTHWNLAQTLPVVLGLGAALIVVGQQALSGIATERLALASKKD